MEISKPRTLAYFGNALRIVVAVILVTVILRSINWREITENWSQLKPGWLLAAFAMVMASLLFSAIRWRTLLRVHAIDLSLAVLLRYYLHAQFFLMLVPSFIGADTARSWDIHRETGQTEAGVASVIIERLAGLHAIITMGFISIWMVDSMQDYPLIRLMVIGLFLLTSAAWVILLSPRFMTFWARFIPVERLKVFMVDLAEATVFYRQHKKVLLLAWAWSLAIQACNVVFMYFLIRNFYSDISIIEVASVNGVIAFISFLPISPGALGIQEGSYVVFLGALGISSENAVLLSLLARVASTLTAALGGIDYAIMRR